MNEQIEENNEAGNHAVETLKEVFEGFGEAFKFRQTIEQVRTKTK